ncbi:MAG: hypothetical protein ACTHOJ_12930, partial [Sphingomonas oligoaromativorans]
QSPPPSAEKGKPNINVTVNRAAPSGEAPLTRRCLCPLTPNVNTILQNCFGTLATPRKPAIL